MGGGDRIPTKKDLGTFWDTSSQRKNRGVVPLEGRGGIDGNKGKRKVNGPQFIKRKKEEKTNIQIMRGKEDIDDQRKNS